MNTLICYKLSCLACEKVSDCGRCFSQLKMKLLEVNKTGVEAVKDGLLSYWLKCQCAIK